MRAVCVLLGVTHTLLGAFALRARDWSGALEGVAVLLLAIVVWFAAPPGARALERPQIGTRSLRLGLYYTVIALGGLAGFSWLWRAAAGAGAGGRTGSSTLLLLILALLIPLLQAEHRDRAAP